MKEFRTEKRENENGSIEEFTFFMEHGEYRIRACVYERMLNGYRTGTRIRAISKVPDETIATFFLADKQQFMSRAYEILKQALGKWWELSLWRSLDGFYARKKIEEPEEEETEETE